MEAMNPQQELPPNYLDEIAPQAPKRSFQLNKMRLLILIGIAAVIVVLIIAGFVAALTSARKQPWEQLAARLAATSEVVESSEGKIKNSQLRSTNSNLKISLTNTQRDLAAPLATANVNPEALSASVTKAESSAAMLERLEDARLNAKYDSTYAREMSYQLANILTVLTQLYNASTNEDNRTYLKSTYDNIQPVHKSLSEFSASNE